MRRRTHWGRVRRALCGTAHRIPQREGERISHFPQLQQRAALATAWAVLWERMGCLGKGFCHSWSSPRCPVCVLTAPVRKAQLEAKIPASPVYPMRKHPAFRQVSMLAHPWEKERHTWLLRCASRKKRNSVLPVPRDAVTQAWPSMSCLDSWAQWEHFRLIPAPGRCSRGQA